MHPYYLFTLMKNSTNNTQSIDGLRLEVPMILFKKFRASSPRTSMNSSLGPSEQQPRCTPTKNLQEIKILPVGLSPQSKLLLKVADPSPRDRHLSAEKEAESLIITKSGDEKSEESRSGEEKTEESDSKEDKS